MGHYLGTFNVAIYEWSDLTNSSGVVPLANVEFNGTHVSTDMHIYDLVLAITTSFGVALF